MPYTVGKSVGFISRHPFLGVFFCLRLHNFYSHPVSFHDFFTHVSLDCFHANKAFGVKIMNTLKYVVIAVLSFAVCSSALAAQDDLLLDQVHKSQRLKALSAKTNNAGKVNTVTNTGQTIQQ